MIICGWCGASTPEGACAHCGRDAVLPWVQRAVEPPLVDGRDELRRRLAAAGSHLGGRATIEQLAEHLEVSPRTVRRWREMAR